MVDVELNMVMQAVLKGIAAPQQVIADKDVRTPSVWLIWITG